MTPGERLRGLATDLIQARARLARELAEGRGSLPVPVVVGLALAVRALGVALALARRAWRQKCAKSRQGTAIHKREV